MLEYLATRGEILKIDARTRLTEIRGSVSFSLKALWKTLAEQPPGRVLWEEICPREALMAQPGHLCLPDSWFIREEI